MEENGKLVQFIFNTNREVISEKETQWTNYIRGSTLLASSTEHARTCYHYASDEMDSITHIVDGEKVLNEYEYDAWGEVVRETETVKNRFKFNGQQLDPITGQYYLRARFYNPVIARFTQEDTYRGDGLNLYAYCRNNPVYYVDTTGYNPNCVKDSVKQLMDEGVSKEDPYRQAYKDHAVNKLSDPNLSPKDRAKIAARQKRLNNQPESPTVEIVGNLQYNHDIKPRKSTDINDLKLQVQAQIDGFNRIIQQEGIQGLKDRINNYSPELEALVRAYVRTLQKAPTGEAHLHLPDMTTGGLPTDVDGTGNSRNNSIIGGQANRIANDILNMSDDTTIIQGILNIRGGT